MNELSALLAATLLCTTLHVQAQKADHQWTFDTPDPSITGTTPNPAFEFVQGVSGKALVFDGYKTEVVQKPDTLGALGAAFTITAWIAPQEYSWNISAIINQEEDLKKGFFFGINQLGQLVGSVATEAGWQTCISANALPLLKWSHVTMVFDETKGITLFINGEKAGETQFAGKLVQAANLDVVLGKTQTKMSPTNTERPGSRAILSWMYLDGLLDEVRFYKSALPEGDLKKQHQEAKIANLQPLQFRRLPSGTDEPRPFGAYLTKLSYSPGWDRLWKGSDYPDIVVRFDKSPVKFVFWRGTGYIPAMVTENHIWMSDQSAETWPKKQCWEAMGDKQCRYSHIRLLENTPARVVIHWRYALANPTHEIWNETDTEPGDWADEYWAIYPDGVAARAQVLWPREWNPKKYEFQETIFFNQPGSKPQDTVEWEAITFMDMEGQKASYSWENDTPKFTEPKVKAVEMINTRSKYRPFSIHHPDRSTGPLPFGMTPGYTNFPNWNHWPVAQVPSDGRIATAPDKPSHSTLGGGVGVPEFFPDGSVRVRELYGLTTGPIDSLLPLARSWNNAPKVAALSAGYESLGYDVYQRAYVFRKGKDAKEPLSFELTATEQSPVVNLPVVIKNWSTAKADVELNGKKLSEGEGFSQGHVSTLDSDDLILWVPSQKTSKVSVKITSDKK